MEHTIRVSTGHRFECYDKHGRLRWVEEITNIVVTVGLNELLDKTFKASAYTAAWFVALKGPGTPDAGDTMASHPTWAELVPYSQATRPALVLSAVVNGNTNNSASKAVFSIDANETVDGGFVVNDDTKSGTTGVLYGASDFANPRVVEVGDTLNVTVSLNAIAS